MSSFPGRCQKLACGLLAAALVAGAVPAAAQDRDRRIAAIVNRDAITQHDLEQRIRLAGLSAQLAARGEARQRIVNEVLRAMINERLQVQEAARQGLQVSEGEVRDQIAEIERRNGMPPGGITLLLRQRNIDPRTFEDQIRAAVAWNKVIQRVIQPQIRVSDVEVRAVLNRLLANKDKLQYRVQEIFLPVDSPAQQGRALQTAQFILGQLRAGASFDIMARQFSQTGSANSGGDLGFLFEGQMEPEIERVVKQMRTGQVAGPVRSAGGYYVLRLADRRTFDGRNPDVKTITVAQATLPVPNRATPAQNKDVLDRLSRIAAEAQTCAALVKAAQDAGGTGRVVDNLVLEQQRPAIRALITPLKTDQKSRPHLEGGAYAVYMRCPDVSKEPEEKDVREVLARQKLGAYADRYLKELRRSAYVDIRV
jgi:peptidyl-prolyl cis-trans isomerase SurA